MKPEQRKELSSRLGELVTFDVAMGKFTTYRIGGPADAFVQPNEVESVERAVAVATELELSWMVLGLGSNILVADEGIPGVVIRLGKGFSDLKNEGEGKWVAQAALPTPRLSRRTADAGFGGIHRLIGVPGTVGGGVFMNAGAHGQEFKDAVDWITVVTAQAEVKKILSADVPWQYRSSGLEPCVVLEAGFVLAEEDPVLLGDEISRNLQWRKNGTPFDQPCCGSVFRNPTQEQVASARDLPKPATAGRLVDGAGMKEHRVGGAQVSSMHGNYIVNVGGATAGDVRSVIADVRDAVAESFGVTLALEVKLVGSHEEGKQ